MSFVNTILRTVFDGLLYPFRGLPPWVGLTLISLIAAIGILAIFKRTSNQDALEAVKRKIHAGLFEIRLFNDDLRAIMRAQFQILGNNLTYLRLSLFPMLFILPPLVLIMVQLQFHYGYSGLEIDAPVLLEVDFREGAVSEAPTAESEPDIELVVPSGIRVETPAVWIPKKRQLAWRIAAEEPGDYEIGLVLDGETYTKAVRVSDIVVRRSPIRVAPGFLDQLLYPAEDPLPSAGPIQAITVGYPEDPFFIGLPKWMWIFFVLSIVFAFALRNKLGVTI
jgi:uncharacterized membrane protein (DUF106 family)